MTKPTQPMPTLQQALDAESYEWLAGTHPGILGAIEREVAGGRTPAQVKLFVLRQTGRFEIAMRCEQVARHILASEK
jgi:hypothetical protein